MIGRDGEQSDEILVTVRSRPACLGDAQGVNRINALGWPDAGVTFRHNGTGHFRRNDATWHCRFGGTNGVKNA